MYLKHRAVDADESYLGKIARLKRSVEICDAVVIGAGAGLSAAAGLLYGGERFDRLFSDYKERYGFKDMYTAAFYNHSSLEELWAYFSKHIYYNRYEQELNSTYDNLYRLLLGKNYFIITTNVDHIFQKTGFDKGRLFYTQGDYGLYQCSVPCHSKTYDNKDSIFEMVQRQQGFKIPSELIPLCPNCGKPMTTNLRKDGSFIEDEGWHSALKRYEAFIKDTNGKHVLFLELGVGFNTPSIIKYPFWQMTYDNENATYACINATEASCAKEIAHRAILIDGDINTVIKDLI